MKSKFAVFILLAFMLSACGIFRKTDTVELDTETNKASVTEPKTKAEPKPKPKPKPKPVKEKPDAPVVRTYRSFVGTSYEDNHEFNELRFLQSKTLEGYNQTFNGKEHSISVFETEQNYTLVFFEEIRRDGEVISYQVIDQLTIWRMAGDEDLFTTCFHYGKADPEIVCICKFSDNDLRNKKYLDNVVKAWRLNRFTREIEIIDTKEVKALNDSYGI